MKEFTPVADLLPSTTTGTADRPVSDATRDRLLDVWKSSLREVGLNSWPLLFRSGRLVAFCESPVWGSTLRHRAPAVLGQLRTAGFNVERIDVRVRPGLFEPTGRPGKTAVITRQQARGIDAAAGGIQHEGLRNALRNLAEHD